MKEKTKAACAAVIGLLFVMTPGCAGGGGRVSSAASSTVSSSVSAVSSDVPQVSSVPDDTVAASKPAGDESADSSEVDNTVSITIPEGYTLAKIATKMEANGICSESSFLSTAQKYDFSYYPLIKALPASSQRAYKLEGYLYPDTYTFEKGAKPQDVIGKLLRGSEQRIDGQYHYSGMTTDQIVTLASIIEKEADDATNMKLVSSVFHNRLSKGMKLEADATITYCTYCLLSPYGPFADKFKYYYNTYRCAALPAGAICNPGRNALSAAANPASSDYCYYITKNGKYYYQKTLDEHNAKLNELGMT